VVGIGATERASKLQRVSQKVMRATAASPLAVRGFVSALIDL
jgi:hypothetical protein